MSSSSTSSSQKMPIQRCLPKSSIGRYIGDKISTDFIFLLYVFEILITFDWKLIISCRNKSALMISKTLPYDESSRHLWQSKPRRGTDSLFSIFYNEKFIFHGNPKLFPYNFSELAKTCTYMVLPWFWYFIKISAYKISANKIWQIEPASVPQHFGWLRHVLWLS